MQLRNRHIKKKILSRYLGTIHLKTAGYFATEDLMN